VSRRKYRINELIIGGSAAYKIPKKIWGNEIDNFTLTTPYGRSNPIHIYEKNKIRFGFISRHGEDGYTTSAGFVNYRANIFAAKLLGVSQILTWSGPGAINPELKPGTLFLPDDILDFTKNREYTFFERNGLGFIRQNPVFCPEIRKEAVAVLRSFRKKYHNGGVYVCTEGPRLETPAEIRAFRKLGGDAVGMTLIPEVFLAKELEICYFPVCYITNYAEGIKKLPFREGELFEGTLPKGLEQKVSETLNTIPELILAILFKIHQRERKCACSVAMLRYRKEGRIGNNWRRWFL